MFPSSAFFLVEPENDIRLLEISIINFLFDFKINFTLWNTLEINSLIIPIYYM